MSPSVTSTSIIREQKMSTRNQVLKKQLGQAGELASGFAEKAMQFLSPKKREKTRYEQIQEIEEMARLEVLNDKGVFNNEEKDRVDETDAFKIKEKKKDRVDETDAFKIKEKKKDRVDETDAFKIKRPEVVDEGGRVTDAGADESKQSREKEDKSTKKKKVVVKVSSNEDPPDDSEGSDDSSSVASTVSTLSEKEVAKKKKPKKKSSKSEGSEASNRSNESDILIGGRRFEVQSQFKAGVTIIAPSCTQKARMDMSPKDREELNRRASAKVCTDVFGMFEKPKAPDKGDGVQSIYAFQSTVRDFQNNVRKYNMEAPFSIIIYKDTDNPSPLGQVDLFKESHRVTAEQVAKSNEWYRFALVDEDEKVAQAENLRVVYEMFSKNVEKELYRTVVDEYNRYTEAEKGGTLFYVIMIHEILSNGREQAKAWLLEAMTLKIQSIPGENINTYASWIESLASLFDTLTSTDPEMRIPSDFADIITSKLSNTSCEKFNELFRKRAVDTSYERYKTESTGTLHQNAKSHAESYRELLMLLKFARKVYGNMREKVEWKGTSNNSSAFVASDNSSAFVASFSIGDCFNCGESGHSSNNCQKPTNSTTIEANKTRFYELKRERGNSNQGSNGGNNSNSVLGLKFPPTNAEKSRASKKGWNKPRRTFNIEGSQPSTFEYDLNGGARGKGWWDKVEMITLATLIQQESTVEDETIPDTEASALDLTDHAAVAKAVGAKFARPNESEAASSLRSQRISLAMRRIFEDLA